MSTAIQVVAEDLACRMCGAQAGERDPYDGRLKIKLHVEPIAESFVTRDSHLYLRAICSVCNEGASNITLQRPDLTKLLVQVRRATALDQKELLLWLKKKFEPKQH
jgi:hypothetical protein